MEEVIEACLPFETMLDGFSARKQWRSFPSFFFLSPCFFVLVSSLVRSNIDTQAVSLPSFSSF
jgi:hypothetical protein